MEHVEEVMAKDFKEKANQCVSLSLCSIMSHCSVFTVSSPCD